MSVLQHVYNLSSNDTHTKDVMLGCHRAWGGAGGAWEAAGLL